MRLSVTTTGITKLSAKASSRANFLGGSGMRRLCEQFGKEMVIEMQNNIMKFTPGKVQDLTEKYKVRKEKLWGRVYPILVAGGEFIDSMRSKVARDGTGWVIQLLFRGTHRGGITNERLAEIHTKGDLSRGLPPRDFTTIKKATEREWLRRVGEALKGVK